MTEELDNLESPEGIFAIIDDDSQEVTMLYFFSAQGDLKRTNGTWGFLSADDDYLLENGTQVAVDESFLNRWDAAEKAGKVLKDSDAERYEINLEQ